MKQLNPQGTVYHLIENVRLNLALGTTCYIAFSVIVDVCILKMLLVLNITCSLWT